MIVYHSKRSENVQEGPEQPREDLVALGRRHVRHQFGTPRRLLRGRGQWEQELGIHGEPWMNTSSQKAVQKYEEMVIEQWLNVD